MGVAENWAAIQATWGAKGPEFFVKLFAKYPDVKPQFPALSGLDDAGILSSPATVTQAENLRKGIDSLITNLTNAAALDAAIDKLAASHKSRGMNPEYFKKAFDMFVEFNSGVSGFDAGAWKSALDDIYKKLAAKM